MKGLKVGLVLLFMLVMAGIAIATTATAIATNTDTAFPAENIPLKEARKLAEYFSKMDFGEDVKVGDYVLFYDLSNSPAVYSFEVIKDDKIYGTVAIGATKDHAPLVMLYKGTPPQYKIKLRNAKYLYPKPFTFVAQYKSQNKKIKWIDLTSGEEIKYNRISPQIFQPNSKTRQEWEFVEKLISGDISPKYVDKRSKKIYGVPYYTIDDQNGCALTAAAMVITYWHNQGYYRFPTDEEYLEDEFKTYFNYNPSEGTEVTSIPPGYENFAADYGYSFESGIIYTNGYWTYVSEIDHERPVTVIQVYYSHNDHANAGIGYEYIYPYSEYLWVHNGYLQTDVKINANEGQDELWYIYLRPN